MTDSKTSLKVIATNDAPAAIGPYSQAIAAGDFVFCSGQIALRPDGSLVSGEVEDEVRQAMDNLRAVLIAAGSSLEKVVQCTLYLADMADFARVNVVYGEYFQSHRPARATVAAAGLPKSVRFEVAAIAVR